MQSIELRHEWSGVVDYTEYEYKKSVRITRLKTPIVPLSTTLTLIFTSFPHLKLGYSSLSHVANSFFSIEAQG